MVLRYDRPRKLTHSPRFREKNSNIFVLKKQKALRISLINLDLKRKIGAYVDGYIRSSKILALRIYDSV